MRRVVITGIGLVTPIGNDLEATWSGLLAGKNGAGPITHFDTTLFATKFACEVKGWDPSRFFDKRELKHLDRFLQFGVAAGLMAVADAGLGSRVPEGEADRWGSYIGAGLGGVKTIEDTYKAQAAKGPRYGFSPYFVTDIIINEAPGMISIRTGATGPNISHVSACSSGAHSIGEAMRTIRHGYADGMIAGGTEATITILGVGGFNAMRAMSTRNDAPEKASRPFDKDRDGFVIGEGAGVVVIEELEHAKARGARIYAELVGYGATSDGYDMVQPSGEGAARCMRMALAHVEDGVDYINPHATSTPIGDVKEIEAIREVFGDKCPPISATKSLTGHSLGGAGVHEAIYSLLMMNNGFICESANIENLDPAVADMPIVRERQDNVAINTVMSNSFGFGGTNATLVFRRLDG
jgi:3-oxoacyl-[acyl-carrier-protein] synthase II